MPVSSLLVPSSACAATISDRQMISLDDGGRACVFKIAGYDKTRDGDIFVVVTGSAGRTVYRPEQNIVEGTQWQGFWGVRFGADVKTGQIDVVVLKNPPAPAVLLTPAAPTTMTLVDRVFGPVKLKLDASGSATAGYTLTQKITITDVGSFDATGKWNPATPDAPIEIEAINIYKKLLEGLLGASYAKDAFSIGEKITATVTLPPEWITQLKKGVTTPEDLKTFATGNFQVSVAIPFKLKLDPTKPAFDMIAIVEPIGRTATMALASGQKWTEPFGFLPVTFSTIEMTTDAKFSMFSVKAVSEIDFIVKSPLALDMTVPKGGSPDLKISMNPDVKIITGALERAKIPVALTDVIKPILEKIKLGSFDISGDFKGMTTGEKLPDVGIKFDIELPSRKIPFDIKILSVDLEKPGDFSIALGNQVFPVLITNLDVILSDLLFAGIKGKWTVADLDIGIGKLTLTAEGDAAKGYAMKGLAALTNVGTLNINGTWSPSAPLDPINFTADNVFKTAFEKSLGGMVPKEWFSLGEKITAKVGLAPEWVERLKQSKPDTEPFTSGKTTIEVSMPFTLKFDPTKPAFKMTATLNPMDKTTAIAMDAGQSWDKPLNILPVKFDKLDFSTDASLTTLTVKSTGKWDFLVPCAVDLVMTVANGNAGDYTVKLTPEGGLNIVSRILDGRVPATLTTLVNELLPNTTIEEITVIMNSTKTKPDVRMKFTMTKVSLSQKFDILVEEVDLSKPDEFAAKAAPQIIDQLAGGALGAATTALLDAIGLSGDWTLVDLDLAGQLILKVNVKGSPSAGYDMTSDIKPLIFEKFMMKGHWDPKKPMDPVTFSANKNVFKPAFDATIGEQLPPGWLELKDELFVKVTFPSALTDALKGGGSGGATSSADGIDIEIGFPMKLKIDPIKKDMFDMIGGVYPMKGQAGLALAPGQIWDKPFDFIPATFNTLNVATDPSFTQITIHAEGTSDFLEGEKLDFKIDLEMAPNKKPDLKIKVTPTVGLAKAIMKKAKIPAALQNCITTIELKKIDMAADFSSVINGKVPECRLAFTVQHPIAGRIDIEVVVPAGDMKDPAGFAKKVAESVISQLDKIVSQLVGNVFKDPVETAKNLGNTAVNTTQDLAVSAKDFFKDPGRNSEELSKAAAKMTEVLGKEVVSAVTAKLEEFAKDPLGPAIKAATLAYNTAVSVVNSVVEMLANIGNEILGFFGVRSGPSDADRENERKANEAKKLAQDNLNKLLAEQAEKRRLDKLRSDEFAACKKAIAAAQTPEDVRKMRWVDDFKAYPNLLESDKNELRDEMERRMVAIALPRSEAMASWRSLMANLSTTTDGIERLERGIKFLDGAALADNRLYPNISNLSASDKETLKSEIKAIMAGLLPRWQKEAMARDRAEMDKAATIQDVTNKVMMLNVDIKSRYSEDQIAELKKYADVALNRVNAAWVNKYTAQINDASSVTFLNKMYAEISSSGNLTEAQKPNLLEKCKAMMNDAANNGSIYAMKSMEKRIDAEMDAEKLNGLYDNLGGTRYSWGPKQITDAALEADLDILAYDLQGRKDILRQKITARLASLSGIQDEVVKKEIALIEKMMHPKELQTLNSRMNNYASPGLDYLSEENKQKLRDAIEKRRKDAPDANAAYKAYSEAIAKATTLTDISNLEDALTGKSVAGLPLILNLDDDRIWNLTGKIDAKKAVLLAEARTKFENEIDKAKTTQEYRALLDALNGMKVQGLDAMVAHLPEGYRVGLKATLNTKVAEFGKSVFDDARSRITKSFTTRESLESLRKYFYGTVTLDKVSPAFVDVFFLTVEQKVTLKDVVATKLEQLEQAEQAEKAIVAVKKAIAAAATPEELDAWYNYICLSNGVKPRADAPDVTDINKIGQLGNVCWGDVKPRTDAVKEFKRRLGDASTEADVAKVIEDIDKSALFSTEMKKNLKIPAQKIKDDLKNGVESDAMQKMQAWISGYSSQDVSNLAYVRHFLLMPDRFGPPTGLEWMGPAVKGLRSADRTKLIIAAELQSVRNVLAVAAGVMECKSLMKEIEDPNTIRVLRGIGSEAKAQVMAEIDAKIAALQKAMASTAPPAPATTAIAPASETRAEITFLYQKIYGRNPDAAGLDWWEKQYAEKGISGITEAFIRSDEFMSKSRSDKIAALYRTILGRDPDVGGLDWYSKSNKALYNIAYDFIDGDDFKKLSGPYQAFIKTKMGLPNVLANVLE